MNQPQKLNSLPRKAKPLLKKERLPPKVKKEWLDQAATWKAWRAWKEKPERAEPEKETQRANRTKRRPKLPSKTTPKIQVSISALVVFKSV